MVDKGNSPGLAKGSNSMATGVPEKNLNGANGANTNVNGSSTNMRKTSKKDTSRKPGTEHKADRHGITNAFDAFGQLMHASRRPLPTHLGNGTYNESKQMTGFRKDLKYLRWRGMGLFASP
jgi:linoleate 10R-lipoxygenase